MLSLISCLVGLTFLLTFSLLLWVMLARPTHWKKITEKEHELWLKRGMPVNWAGSIREFDRSWLAKALVALTIIIALVLIASAIILPFRTHHLG